MGVLYQNGELIYGGERIKRITQYDYDRLSTAEKNNGVIYNIYDADGIQGYNPKGVALTQAEYDALVEAGETDSNTMYFITDGTTTTLQSVWDKVGSTPLDSNLPSDCSQAINQLQSNLTDLGTAVLLGINQTASAQMTISLSDSMLNYRSIRIIATFVLGSNNARIVITEIDKTYVEYLLNLTSYSYFLDLHTFYNTSTFTACNIQLSANNEVKMREKSNTTTTVSIRVYGIK